MTYCFTLTSFFVNENGINVTSAPESISMGTPETTSPLSMFSNATHASGAGGLNRLESYADIALLLNLAHFHFLDEIRRLLRMNQARACDTNGPLRAGTLNIHNHLR